MLVLSRRKGEIVKLMQSGNVIAEITIVETDKTRSRLGIEAPTDVRIVRNELEKLKEEKETENGL